MELDTALDIYSSAIMQALEGGGGGRNDQVIYLCTW